MRRAHAGGDARPWGPDRPTLRRMEAAVQECRGCELWEDATQAVLSTGGDGARLMLSAERGQVVEGPGGRDRVITTHPSAVLRLRSRGGYDEALAELVADLRVAGGAGSRRP